MELRDKVIVVTGGASGIGAALCRRFAAEGARGIVVADRNGAGAAELAAEIGALAVEVDVSLESDVQRMVERATDAFGPLDLLCSNAGILEGIGSDGPETGPFAPDTDWSRSWSVNVMGHVYAARAALPSMLERGRGYLLNTASAAGLLTDIGTLVYSVTKHAAVGLAEWLAIAYGDRGIGVSCLCPMGVRTALLDGVGARAPLGHVAGSLIEAEDVAEAVVAGLATEAFLILPHPEVSEYFGRKASDYDRWIRGMRRLRAGVLEAHAQGSGGETR